MTNFNTIRVIHFYGKGDETFLAEAKRNVFIDLLLGKLSNPKADEIFNEVSVIGKKIARTIK
jgi:hypothetical protein